MVLTTHPRCYTNARDTNGKLDINSVYVKDCALPQAGLVTVSTASQGNIFHCFLFKRDLDYSTTYSNRKNRPQKKVSVDNVNLCKGKRSSAILVTILQTATQGFSSVQSHLNQTKESNVTALCK